MGWKLEATQLLSRVIRQNVVEGKSGNNLLGGSSGSGLRKIAINAIKRTGDQDGGGFWGGLVSVAGWLWGAASSGISWTAAGIWGLIVGTTNQVKGFNWNKTDKEIAKTIEARNNQMASIWGGVVGSGVGWLAGIGVGYGVALTCPVIGGAALARAVAGAVSAEALDEMKGKLKIAIQQTAQMLISTTANIVFINYRNFLRNADEGVLENIYGKDTAKWIKEKWGRDGQPDISFNKRMDEFIENLPGGQIVKNFAEEFFEEAWDSFVEAGYVVAHELDSAYAQAKLAAKEAALGSEKSIEITLDADAPDETITYANVPQRLIVPMAQQSINTYRILNGKDVGQIIGEPYETGLQRALPLHRQLVLHYRESAKPPYKPLGKGGKKIVVSIPDPKPGLTWKEVKAVANSYTWGKWKAKGTFPSRRTLTVYAESKAEAMRQLQKFAELCTEDLIVIDVVEEELRDPRIKKEPTEIHVSYCTFLYRKENSNGKTQIDGKTVKEKVKKIPLWQDDAPTGVTVLEAP